MPKKRPPKRPVRKKKTSQNWSGGEGNGTTDNPDKKLPENKDHTIQTEVLRQKKMQFWDKVEVTTWLKQMVSFPDDIVQQFYDNGVDGYTLIHYTKEDLHEDFSLSVGQCRKLLYKCNQHCQEEIEMAFDHPSSKASSSPRISTQAEDLRLAQNDTFAEGTEDIGENINQEFSKLQNRKKNTASARLENRTQGMLTSKRTIEAKLAELLIGMEKGKLDSSFYPVLCMNKPPGHCITEMENKFAFIASVNWNVVFDCNPDSNKIGLCNYVKERKNIKILSPRDFDTRDYEKQRQDIDFPEVPVWIFPNGRVDVEESREEVLSDMVWMRERSHAVANTVRFFSDPEVIPPGRAVVVFLLFSQDNIMVMTQIFREFFTSFKTLQHFTVIANEDKILDSFVTSLELHRLAVREEMMDRCVCASWEEVNTYMLRLLGSCETRVPELPKSPKGACQLLKKHQSQWSDISVLARNECENTSMDVNNPNFADFVQEKERRFYQGHEVEWWNLYLSEDKLNGGKGFNHVLKREAFKVLQSAVDKSLARQGKKVECITLMTIFHEAGSGGTTVAKSVLWKLHSQYRCAVVNRITNDTVNQIMFFRRYGYEQSRKPGPVILLLENLDTETMRVFLINLERVMIHGRVDGLAFVLLHCKRTNEPHKLHSIKGNQPCVVVQHKLTDEERDWFVQKSADLEKREVFHQKDSPELLLAFMVMKSECNSEYLKRVVRQILRPELAKESSKNALCLLKYIVAIHKFDPDFSMPVSACDEFMQETFSLSISRINRRRRPWESDRPQFLKLLLIEESIQDVAGYIKGLRPVHHIVAEEILDQLCEHFHQSPADMILEFIDHSAILNTLSHSKEYLKMICRDLMVHRKKKEYGDSNETQFSPFIENVYHEDKATAFKILEKGVAKFQDPIIAQHKARLHSIYDRDNESAEKAINIALELNNKNSCIWHTKGIIHRDKMAVMGQSKEKRQLSDDEMKELLDLFGQACTTFQKSQSVNEEDANSNNNGVYFGEIDTIFKFLEIFEKRVKPFCDVDGLHKMRKYLLTDYIPADLKFSFSQDEHSHLKGLQARVETVYDCVTDYMSQCAKQRFHNAQDALLNRIEKIYASRNHFFGIHNQESTDLQNQPRTACIVRRAEVVRMRGDSYHHIFDMASGNRIKELKEIQALLRQNLTSPNFFDVKYLVMVSFALSVFANEEMDEIEVRKMVEHLKELEEDAKGTFGLFFELLLNWPDRVLSGAIPPIKETMEKLEVRWKKRHNRLEIGVDSNIHRRSRMPQQYTMRAATDFYLGEKKKRRLLHKNVIGKTTQSFWKEEASKKYLAQLEGVLDNKDYVIYSTRREGPIKIRLSLPIEGLPSREPVKFYLGFSFSGPVAYGVKYKDRDTLISSSEIQFPTHAYIDTSDNSPYDL